MAERSFRFARNLSWNMLGQVAVAALNFACIPYLVARMGVETYGLYIILHAVASYLLLFSFGAGSAAIKYVAESNAAGDRRAMGDAIRYSISLHAVGTIMAAVVLCFWARFFLVRVFHVPEHLLETGVFVLRCAAAGAFFAAMIQFSTSIITGLQRFEWNSFISILQNGLMPLGAAALLAAGLGLKGVTAWFVTLNALVCLVAFSVVWKVLRLRFNSPEGQGIPFKKFTLWGLSQWLGPFAWIVSYQFDKIFIVRSESLIGLTLYAVPAGLLQRIQSLFGIISVVIIPMMSELKGAEGEAALKRMYLKSVRFILWMLLPLLALLFAMMPQFLTLWLGKEFGGQSVWPARLLVLAQMFAVLTVMPNTAAFSRKPLFIPAVAWSQALISLLAWKILIPRYELLGVAMGSLIAQAIPACVCLAVAHRQLIKLSWSEFLSDGLYAPGLSAALMLALVFPLHGMATNWGRLLLLCASGYVVYYGSTLFFMNSDDRQLLRKFLRWEKR